MYQCTYPGCHEQRLSVDAMESHVRVEHLNRPEELDLSIDEADRDHEEEFYYTETEFEEVIDVTEEPPQLQQVKEGIISECPVAPVENTQCKQSDTVISGFGEKSALTIGPMLLNSAAVGDAHVADGLGHVIDDVGNVVGIRTSSTWLGQNSETIN